MSFNKKTFKKERKNWVIKKQTKELCNIPQRSLCVVSVCCCCCKQHIFVEWKECKKNLVSDKTRHPATTETIHNKNQKLQAIHVWVDPTTVKTTSLFLYIVLLITQEVYYGGLHILLRLVFSLKIDDNIKYRVSIFI